MNKRSFLKYLAAFGIGGSVLSASAKPFSLDQLNWDADDIWDQIRAGYRIKRDYLNFENGYYCFLPEELLEKYIAHIREVNFQASHYMRGVQVENKAKSAAALAQLVGADPEEVVLTRNTTESLDLIISGFPWKAGDEAIFSNQDYGSMQSMFELAGKRWGIKTVKMDIPIDPKTDEEIVEAYRKPLPQKPS